MTTNLEKPSRRTVAHWLHRAIADLVIERDKDWLENTQRHIEWAMADLKSLTLEKSIKEIGKQ